MGILKNRPSAKNWSIITRSQVHTHNCPKVFLKSRAKVKIAVDVARELSKWR